VKIHPVPKSPAVQRSRNIYREAVWENWTGA
jgi:hypothetical protein